jgi:hypothetical protein
MIISFEIPEDIARRLIAEGVDLNRQAKEVFLLWLYRERKITRGQLGETLGLDDSQTDSLLNRSFVTSEGEEPNK